MTTNVAVFVHLACTTSIGYAIAWDRGAAIGLAIGSALIAIAFHIANSKD